MSPTKPTAAAPAELQRMAAQARQEIHRVIHGYDHAINLLLVALGARGHVVLEGVPGLGKTTLAKAFASVTGLTFTRVQLTPDLMPTDITGHTYWDPNAAQFKLRKGPVFTNVLLADEINRTPPRTQAALLEVMQEHQVTIEGQTLPVPQPFLVMATKNPIEVEGVYPLPEAELDRFLVQIDLSYPGRDAEIAMLQGKLESTQDVNPVPGLLDALHGATRTVRAHPDVLTYLLDIVETTRSHDAIELGASPRASEHLLNAARAHAALQGRAYLVPDDVKRLAPDVLGHRLLLSAEAEVQGTRPKEVLAEILERTTVPVAQGGPDARP